MTWYNVESGCMELHTWLTAPDRRPRCRLTPRGARGAQVARVGTKGRDRDSGIPKEITTSHAPGSVLADDLGDLPCRVRLAMLPQGRSKQMRKDHGIGRRRWRKMRRLHAAPAHECCWGIPETRRAETTHVLCAPQPCQLPCQCVSTP
jgi:hypothetical protein